MSAGEALASLLKSAEVDFSFALKRRKDRFGPQRFEVKNTGRASAVQSQASVP